MTAITTVALDSVEGTTPVNPVGWPVGRHHSQETCYLMGASRLGIDPSEYAAKREAGLLWCFRCRKWQPSTEFGAHKRYQHGFDTQCREAAREYAREYQRRKRATARQEATG